VRLAVELVYEQEDRRLGSPLRLDASRPVGGHGLADRFEQGFCCCAFPHGDLVFLEYNPRPGV
jgi:hypothetical protein